jgi:hypothetical protein
MTKFADIRTVSFHAKRMLGGTIKPTLSLGLSNIAQTRQHLEE